MKRTTMNALPAATGIAAALATAMWLCVSPAKAESAEPASPLDLVDVYTSGEGGYHTYRIPSLLRTPEGALLAFAEGRSASRSDAGDIDLLVKRSADGGRTWSDAQVIWDDGPNTCGNPCPVVDRETGTIHLLMTRNLGHDTEREIIDQTSDGTRTVWTTTSADDGRTWSTPREITDGAKPDDWTWYATGPGVGIQLEHGEHAGRLVIPCDHIEAGTKKYSSHVIYSDDHGVTWRLGGSSPVDQVNECQVVEFDDARLMLNMRNYDRSQRTRAVCESRDGGMTWTGFRHDPALIEPICQASLIRAPVAGGRDALLFSNPASRDARVNMTVRASFDEGQTWPIAIPVWEGPSAYSCLAPLDGGDVGLLFERGEQHPYERITFATIPGRALVPDQEDDRMEWWRDARFGMFIHWGLYAIPAGEWNDETHHAEWIRTTAQIPIDTYDRFVDQFNPVKFNADRWARLAKQAGMKYIIITSKHHDGFCLFDSAHTEFDVMSTPFQRDIMKELAEACRRHGLRIGWYHSIMDWHHPDYLPRRGWETDRPTEGADFDRYVQHLHKQVTELLTNYGDVGVMWFDGEWESTWNHEYGKALYDLCRRLQPDVIVNNRVDKGREGMAGLTREGEFAGDFGTPEQEIPATGLPGVDWETCMTMNDHWGWNRHDDNWKSTEDLIRKLSDIASKGGNFLLNIGPRPDGTFPQEAVERLEEIGAWMDVNGEAIHATEASPFGKLPWGRCTVQHSDSGDATLYLHVFDWPGSRELVVPGLGNGVRGATLLATGERLAARRAGANVFIELPAAAPDPACSVVRLEIEGAPIVYEPPTIEAVADIFVRPLTVRVASPSEGLVARYTTDGAAPTADSPRADRPITIERTTTITAQSFRGERPASDVVSRTFERVSPRQSVQTFKLDPGVQCATYEGEWNALPDFASLEPVKTEIVERIALRPDDGGEHTARRYTGFIRVPIDAVYVFELTSDDGSRLLLHDEVVVNNDGLHVAQAKRGVMALEAGLHPIAVEWFNRTGDAALSLEFAPLGDEPRPVPPDALGW